MPVGQQHDLRRPPLARVVSKRLIERGGEWAIVGNVEVLDEEAFANFGGYSVAFSAERQRVFNFGDLIVSFNPRQLDSDVLRATVPAEVGGHHVELVERIEKASVLELALIYIMCQVPGEAWKGFWGAAGADLWQSLSKLRRKEGDRQKPIEVAIIDKASDTVEVIVAPEPDVDARRIGDIPIGRFVAEAQELVRNPLVKVVIRVPLNNRPYIDFALDVQGTTIFPDRDDSFG